MNKCFFSYDYTSKIFDVFAGKTNKGKVIHTFKIATKAGQIASRITNKMIYKCSLQIISYYQKNGYNGYTVYFDQYIARIFDEFEPVFKNSRDIEQERSLVETTVIQIEL